MQIMKSEDVSFNPDLKSLCAAPLEKLCGREEGPAALTCLIDNVADPSLTTACRSRIETEAQKQAKNIQFRPLLLSACKQDLEDMVKDGRCQDDVWSLTEGAGIDCLTKRRHEVRSKQCKNSIAVVLRDQSKVCGLCCRPAPCTRPSTTQSAPRKTCTVTLRGPDCLRLHVHGCSISHSPCTVGREAEAAAHESLPARH